jgi:hypothetical protein
MAARVAAALPPAPPKKGKPAEPAAKDVKNSDKAKAAAQPKPMPAAVKGV